MEVLTECGLPVETSLFPDLNSPKNAMKVTCRPSHFSKPDEKVESFHIDQKTTWGDIAFYMNEFNIVQLALTVVCFLAANLLHVSHCFPPLLSCVDKHWESIGSSNLCLSDRLGFCLHLVFGNGTAFQKIIGVSTVLINDSS